MGRPPIGKQAMTDAERQRRHRAKFRDNKPVTKPKADGAETATLRAELARAKKRIADLEAFRDKPTVTKPEIDLTEAPKTWRQKFESMERRMRRELTAEFEGRFEEEKARWVEWYRPVIEEAEIIKNGRKGLITKQEGTTITRCLHPDASASTEMRHKAFIVWRRIEHLLMREEDSPTSTRLPRTAEDFEKFRRKKAPR